jgi:hypothetical protein
MIADDDQQICVGAGHDLAELPRTLHDLGVDDGCGVDDFVRRHRLGTDEELAALIVLHLAEEVAAEADLHAGRTAKLERAQARVEHDLVFLQTVGGQSVAGTTPLQAIVGDQRGHDVRAALGHELRAGGVDQVAVLDGAHTAADRASNCLGRIRVRQNVRAPMRRFFHRRLDLVQAELNALQRIAL